MYIDLNRKVANYIRIQKIFTNLQLAVLFLRGNIKQSEMQAIKKGLIWNYLDLPCGVYGCLVVNVSKCSSCNPTLKDNLVVKPKAQRGQHVKSNTCSTGRLTKDCHFTWISSKPIDKQKTPVI